VSVCVSARACARQGAARGMGVRVIFILVVASCGEQDDGSASGFYFCHCEL